VHCSVRQSVPCRQCRPLAVTASHRACGSVALPQHCTARSVMQRSPQLRSRSSCLGGRSRFLREKTAFHLAPARGTGPAQLPLQREERPPIAAAV
jgi:hypothetical protein